MVVGVLGSSHHRCHASLCHFCRPPKEALLKWKDLQPSFVKTTGSGPPPSSKNSFLATKAMQEQTTNNSLRQEAARLAFHSNAVPCLGFRSWSTNLPAEISHLKFYRALRWKLYLVGASLLEIFLLSMWRAVDWLKLNRHHKCRFLPFPCAL